MLAAGSLSIDQNHPDYSYTYNHIMKYGVSMNLNIEHFDIVLALYADNFIICAFLISYI